MLEDGSRRLGLISVHQPELSETLEQSVTRPLNQILSEQSNMVPFRATTAATGMVRAICIIAGLVALAFRWFLLMLDRARSFSRLFFLDLKKKKKKKKVSGMGTEQYVQQLCLTFLCSFCLCRCLGLRLCSLLFFPFPAWAREHACVCLHTRTGTHRHVHRLRETHDRKHKNADW